MIAAPKIDHVGILVESFDEVGSLLSGALGLHVPVPQREESLGLDIVWVDAAGVGLEFIRPFDSGTKAAELLRRGVRGVHHVAFEVHGLDDLLLDLGRADIALNDNVPRPGVHGSRIAFIDPASADGMLIELVEHASRSHSEGEQARAHP